jgi:fucose permease
MENSNYKNNNIGIFISCYYIFFVNGMLALLIGSLLPYIQESYNLDYLFCGILVSAHALGNLCSSFLGGILPIKIGRKNTLLLLGAFGVISFVLMTLNGSHYILLSAFFFTGINRGAVSNFNNSVMNDVATGKAWALNLLHAFFSVGAFSAPILVLFITKNTHQNWIFVALIEAILIIISLLVVFFMNVPNNYPAKKDSGLTDWSFVKNKYFLVATAILFTYLCAEQAINGWLVTYLKDSKVLSSEFSQIMTSVLWLVILVGRLITAILSTKVKKQYLLLGTGIGYIIFALILLFIHQSLITSIGVIGVGLSMAGIYATTISGVGEVLKKYPAALSILLTVGGLGATIMPSIVGAVAGKIGIEGGMGVIILAVCLNLFFIIFNIHIRKNDEFYINTSDNI